MNWNPIIFIQQNALDIVVCQDVGHLSSGRWVESVPSHLDDKPALGGVMAWYTKQYAFTLYYNNDAIITMTS